MLITYIFGGVFVLVALGIFMYNWKHPSDDYKQTIAEAIRDSKLVWGFWHTGERAKHSFRYGSVKRILLLEPNPDNESFKHVLQEAIGTSNKNDIITNLNLTKEAALANHIESRWHNEITSLSFMICDPSPHIEGDLVTFSQRAFIIAQVLDRNLNIEEWSVYKKTKAKDKYAFNGYVNWFKDVWDNRSKPLTP